MSLVRNTLLTVIALEATTVSVHTSAEPPMLQASGPIIYLADNLDEENGLGWCIDTIGPGFSETLHSRACSADDGDTEGRDFSFTYDPTSGQIAAVTFGGKCVTANTEGTGPVVGLYDCQPENPAQLFVYDAEEMTFHPGGNESICITAATESVDHGMFQSRALALQACNEVDATLRQWLIKPE